MSQILARRYAKALFLLGREDGKHRQYGQELNEFLTALDEADQSGQALISPFYPKDQRGQALEAILDQGGLSGVVKNFLKLMHDKGRLGILKAVVAVYSEMCDEAEGLIKGTLTTASPLTDSQLSAIKGALNIMSGLKVELKVVVDPSIIGGLVAKLGDLVVDSSLKTQLAKLGQSLNT
jgi:F-type H+-transporting ATPase subunit delta